MLSLLRICLLLLAGCTFVHAERAIAFEGNVVVLVFMSSECPISNKVAPEIQRLFQKYSTNGVAFWAVYPNKSDTEALINKHRREYRLSVPYVRDRKHELVKKSHADVTPEAAVFNKGTLVYRGRITDQFLALGKSRPEATSHDLDEAIAAAVTGRSPPHAHLPAVGCYIEEN